MLLPSAAPVPSGGERPVVTVLRWPADRDLRQQLAEARVPRVLLVQVGQTPPPVVDELEDWVREPVDAADLVARMETLSRRLDTGDGPRLDDGGLLRHRGRWVAIPDAQLAVVALLLARLGELVPMAEVVAAYTETGGSGEGGAIRSVISRIRSRIEEVGLDLQVVRERGVVLDVVS